MHEYRAELVRVVDGDTVELDIDLGFSVRIREMVRLLGIDAPERRGAERAAGEVASAHLRSLLDGRALVVQTHKDDSFGRWLGALYADGEDVSQRMVSDGHAEEYRP